MKKFILSVIALTACLISWSTNAQAVQYDLSLVTDSDTDGTAIFTRFAEGGQGTGNFDSFLRVQDTPQEEGYNTDGTVEFDTKDDPHTHSIEISDIPIIDILGTDYYEFVLDAAEPAGNTLEVTVLEIYLLGAPNITDYATWSSLNTPKYELASGDSILIDNITGNGVADLFVYVPTSLFTGTNTWVYLYTEMIVTAGSFEEWGRRTGIGDVPPVIPEPMSMILFGTGLVGIIVRKKLS
ncbi:MAG TPA: PEP-CTERM sorting domain-containing protein [Candidatus Omnitrophota bacterium]|nr:PEP-CTERM sorting domain-containing protein [Candidatus Omnitrophota bacterium]